MKTELKRFGITRSLQDRLFLGAFGLLFGLPTGYGLFLRFTAPRIDEGTAILSRATTWFIIELVTVVFLLSACAVIWAVAAPRWLEEGFMRYIRRFVGLLAISALAVFAVMIYAFINGA